MSKRLEILKASLVKKEAALDAKFTAHFADVKRANGQPLNDKRNGHVTLNRWDKQSDGIRKAQAEIQKTKDAIEFEEGRIRGCEYVKDMLPKEILALVESGELIQWRKHPNTFFVEGVDKARIVWDDNKKQVAHKYTSAITDKDQWSKFVKVFNPLGKALNNQ